jgi:hypothetical protein
VPERLDRVLVTTRRATTPIPWASRDALVERMRHLDSAGPTRDAFLNVGASRPAELTPAQEELLFTVIDDWARDAGGKDELPPGIWDLRNALVDEFHDTGRGP